MGNDPFVGPNTYLYVPDDYVNNSITCQSGYITHGAGVAYLASQNISGPGLQLNVNPQEAVGTTYVTTSNDRLAAAQIAVNDIATHQSGRGVINISAQGAYSYTVGNAEFDFAQAVYERHESHFLMGLVNMLNALDDNVLGSTVFVVSAGNGTADNGSPSMNLTSLLQSFHNQSQYSRVFGLGGGPHIIIVGGEKAGGGIDAGFNYASLVNGSDGSPLMVYANASNIPFYPAGGNNGCTGSGTSFAAPQVSSLIAQLLSANPNLTAAQVTKAFMQAAASNGYGLPTFAQVNAILNPPPSFSLTVATAGNGDGTVGVSTVGSSCGASCYSYLSNTVVTVTATPATGSIFDGWIGATTGTNAAVFTMNSNQTVTAVFSSAANTFSVSPTSANLGTICLSQGGPWTVILTVAAPANLYWWVNSPPNGWGGSPMTVSPSRLLK